MTKSSINCKRTPTNHNKLSMLSETEYHDHFAGTQLQDAGRCAGRWHDLKFKCRTQFLATVHLRLRSRYCFQQRKWIEKSLFHWLQTRAWPFEGLLCRSRSRVPERKCSGVLLVGSKPTVGYRWWDVSSVSTLFLFFATAFFNAVILYKCLNCSLLMTFIQNMKICFQN